MIGRWRVSVGWAMFLGMGWYGSLCNCLRLGVGWRFGFWFCVGVMRFWLGLWEWLFGLSVLSTGDCCWVMIRV